MWSYKMSIYLLHFCLSLFSLILIILVPLCAILLYAKITTKWVRSPVCLVGKTVIVTGANSGLGFYTAREFAKRGAKVILACRNAIRAENAKKQIVEETENSNVHVKIVDMLSFKSIRNFAKEICASEERLDILVNNAGALLNDEISVDGLNQTMQVNNFGPLLLTILLIDLLKKSKPSRIVNVSSSSIYFARVNINNINYYSHSFIARLCFYNYGNSKLCNLILMNEVARKLKGSGVTVNAVDPFMVYTEIARNWSIFWDIIYACKSIIKPLFRTGEEGAQSSIYVALSKDIEHVTGGYYQNSVSNTVPRIAYDEIFAKRLWDKCIPLLQLTEEERFNIEKLCT